MPSTRPSTASSTQLPRQSLHSSRSAAIGDALMSTYNQIRDKTNSTPSARPRTGATTTLPTQPATQRRHVHSMQQPILPSTVASSASAFGVSTATSSFAASQSRRSPWNLHDMSTALPSWPEKPLTARRRPRDTAKVDEEDGDEEEDDYSESVSEVERKSVGLHGDADVDADCDMRPFVSSSLLGSPALSRPYSPISSSSSRPVSRLSSRSSVNSSIRPSPSSSLPSSHRSSLSSTSASTPSHLRSASRLRDLPEFECGKYVNSGRLAAECGDYPNLHNLLQLQREREEAATASVDTSREVSQSGRRVRGSRSVGRHVRYSSASVSAASPSMLSSIEQSSDDEAMDDDEHSGSTIPDQHSGDECDDDGGDEVHPPIVMGNFFTRQPASCAVEESKLAVEFDGGSVSMNRVREDSGSEEGRSRPVSSRGSRRNQD